jgi:hypothetical protein
VAKPVPCNGDVPATVQLFPDLSGHPRGFFGSFSQVFLIGRIFFNHFSSPSPYEDAKNNEDGKDAEGEEAMDEIEMQRIVHFNARIRRRFQWEVGTSWAVI